MTVPKSSTSVSLCSNYLKASLSHLAVSRVTSVTSALRSLPEANGSFSLKRKLRSMNTANLKRVRSYEEERDVSLVATASTPDGKRFVFQDLLDALNKGDAASKNTIAEDPQQVGTKPAVFLEYSAWGNVPTGSSKQQLSTIKTQEPVDTLDHESKPPRSDHNLIGKGIKRDNKKSKRSGSPFKQRRKEITRQKIFQRLQRTVAKSQENLPARMPKAQLENSKGSSNDLDFLRSKVMDSVSMNSKPKKRQPRGKAKRREKQSQLQHGAAVRPENPLSLPFRSHSNNYLNCTGSSEQEARSHAYTNGHGDSSGNDIPNSHEIGGIDHWSIEQRIGQDVSINSRNNVYNWGQNYENLSSLNQQYLMQTQPNQNQENQYYADQNQEFQYQGLGQGIWPLPFLSSAQFSWNMPIPPDLEQSFNNMHVGQSPLPPGNQYNGISPVSQGIPWSFTSINPAMSIGPGNFPHSSMHTQGSFTQTASIHTSMSNDATLPGPRDLSRKPAKPDSEDVEPPVEPKPKAKYLSQARVVPQPLSAPQPLLIISDINGTLLNRKRGTAFSPRPGLSSFMSYILDLDENSSKPASRKATKSTASMTFMVWTSATKYTARKIIDALFTPAQRSGIAAIWSRETLDLTPEQYQARTQVYKKLERVWANGSIQSLHPHYTRGGRWGQHNTILIDDSIKKAISEPYNLINVPELTPSVLRREREHAGIAANFAEAQKQWRKLQRSGLANAAAKSAELSKGSGPQVTEDTKPGTLVLQRVAEYIHEARWYSDVSAFIRAKPFNMQDGAAALEAGPEGLQAGDEEYISDEDEESSGDTATGVRIS